VHAVGTGVPEKNYQRRALNFYTLLSLSKAAIIGSGLAVDAQSLKIVTAEIQLF
jgi:hypothetical protein